MSENQTGRPGDRSDNHSDNFSPVTVTQIDFFGVIILGLLSFITLFALLRSEARYRALLRELRQGSSSSAPKLKGKGCC